jgi:ABC-2 type transport system permease protein
MRAYLKLTWIETKLLWREPIGLFFTLAFPLLMLFLFGSIYGNAPSPFLAGYGSVDISVPAYSAMIIATSGLLTLSISMASNRENGVLRRLRATPVRPLVVLGAQMAVIFTLTVCGMALLVVAGKIFYGLRFNGSPLAVAAAFVLSSVSFFAMGFVLASLLPTARTAQVVGMIIFYPMIFLSGSTIPLESLPAGVRSFARFLPLTHVVTLLRGLWIGEAWSRHGSEVAVLLALLAVSVIVAAKIFRWE